MPGTNVVIIATTITALLSGCSGEKASTGSWLLAVAGDTVYVAEVQEAWNRMPEESRSHFLHRANPGESYLNAFARKVMLDMELESAGYLTDPGLLADAEAWFRYMAAGTIINMLRTRAENSLSEEEIRFFLEHSGKTVWYTLAPGDSLERSLGPRHLPEISPMDLAMRLAAMEPGQTQEGDSAAAVRLDSIHTIDPGIVAAALADSVQSRGMAVLRLSRSRVSHYLGRVREGMGGIHQAVIDTTAVDKLAESFNESGERPVDDMVVLASTLGDWTVSSLMDEIDFHSSRRSVLPSSAEWLMAFLDDVIIGALLLDSVATVNPGLIDSIRGEADDYILEQAAEWLYRDAVSSRIVITEDDLHHQMSMLPESDIMPERRVLRIAVLPSDSLLAYRYADSDSRLEDFISRLQGMPGYAGDTGDPQVTRPLLIHEVPMGYGDTVFEADTGAQANWLGPLALGTTDQSILVRVEEVVPAEATDPAQVRLQLETAARSRLEEEAVREWIAGLEGKYGLMVNETALVELELK